MIDDSGINVTPIINSITEQGALAGFMLLVILGLGWLVKYLLKRNDSLGDKVTEGLMNNTVALTTLTEVVRASNSKN